MKRALIAISMCVLPGCFIGKLYATPWPQPVEVHRVQTTDGWQLDLRHVRPVGDQRSARPVILVHGIVTNGRSCDFDQEHSLARELARRGFDVWIPSLRGTGESEKRSLFSVKDDESDFDAFVTRDLPAIIGYVQQQTGAAQVDYVGHSMGGLILYAYLARGGQGLGRAVTMGSPVRMRWTGYMEALLRSSSGVSGASRWVPIRSAALMTVPIQGTLDGPLERLLISDDNISAETWQKFVAVGADDVPSALATQFAGWVRRDRFDSASQTIDYLDRLRSVKIPVMVMAGKIDGIAPPWLVRPAYDALGSSEKRWVVLGEGNGQSADYNHMDLLLGDHASKDVFPLIAAFLGKDAAAPSR